jgi:UDP-N-acetyl-2-amino-2-deoxyglucuronate dehydrogenase
MTGGESRGGAPLRIGIVGCGGAAASFAEAIDMSRVAIITATHDRDLGRATALARPRGATPHRSLRGLLADPSVDVVYVALPHDRLASTTIAALRSGHHALVEKPVALRAADVDRIRDAGTANGRSVGVAFQLRFVPTVAAAHDLVAAGALGMLRAVRIRTLIDKPPTYWAAGPAALVHDPWRASLRRAGGGVVLMNAIHQLDLVRAIAGRRVERVGGFVTAGVPGVAVEDHAVAALQLEGGVLGTLAASAHAPGALDDETIEIEGDAGTLRLGDPYADRPRLDVFVRRDAAGLAADRWTAISPAPVDPWVAAISAFSGAIAAGRDPVPGLDDAEEALRTVLAIYRSARTGRVERVWPTRPETEFSRA